MRTMITAICMMTMCCITSGCAANNNAAHQAAIAEKKQKIMMVIKGCTEGENANKMLQNSKLKEIVEAVRDHKTATVGALSDNLDESDARINRVWLLAATHGLRLA